MSGEVRVGFGGRERVVLLVLLGAGFMMSVDFSILNVALPEAGAGVGLGADGLPWITSAFALPAAGFTLLFGRLGDLFGRRRMFLTGMGLLAGASLIGGLASSADVLLTARALQGWRPQWRFLRRCRCSRQPSLKVLGASAYLDLEGLCCRQASRLGHWSAAHWSACLGGGPRSSSMCRPR